MSGGFTVLIPCKKLGAAKSRTGLAAEVRAELAAAFLADVVPVALAVDQVEDVVVVSPDPRVGAVAQQHGAHWFDDGGAPDLNSALNVALDTVGSSGCRSVAMLVADLPCLVTAELESALLSARRARPRPVFVADASGRGTTLLASTDHRLLEPSFGALSAVRHRHKGYLEVSGALAGLRADVDGPEDLWRLSGGGVGSATAALASRFDLGMRSSGLARGPVKGAERRESANPTGRFASKRET